MKINTKTVITVSEVEVQALLLEHITQATGLTSIPVVTWQDGQVILEYTESPTKAEVEEDTPPFTPASTEEPTVEEKLKKIKDAEGINKQPNFVPVSTNLFAA